MWKNCYKTCSRCHVNVSGGSGGSSGSGADTGSTTGCNGRVNSHSNNDQCLNWVKAGYCTSKAFSLRNWMLNQCAKACCNKCGECPMPWIKLEYAVMRTCLRARLWRHISRILNTNWICPFIEIFLPLTLVGPFLHTAKNICETSLFEGKL